MASSRRYYYNKNVAIAGNLRASRTFSDWIENISRIAQGIFQFIGDEGVLTADDISQGITQRVRELADRDITRNPDGTIDEITYRDPDTGVTVATESFDYNLDGTLDMVTESTAEATVQETFTYNLNLEVIETSVEVSGF